MGLGAAVLAIAVCVYVLGGWNWLAIRLAGGSTVADRVSEFAAPVAERLRPLFDVAGVEYPPKTIELAAFKSERRLELYAADSGGRLRLVKTYSILGASGRLGPKLREGDRQVPEGLYQVDRLNPNSSYHLSLHVNYPNAFDVAQARRDARTDLGGDIFIHGGSSSIGCLAMGDAAAEELFVLCALLDEVRVPIVISPMDFRVTGEVALPEGSPDWAASLYPLIRERIVGLGE